jgi:hypothetical protein
LGRFRLHGDFSYFDFYQKYFVKKIAVVQKCLSLSVINIAMQEMNYIHLSRPDYRAISGLAMIPTPTSGPAEHNPPKANETDGSLASFNHQKQFGRDGLWRNLRDLKGYLIVTQHN